MNTQRMLILILVGLGPALMAGDHEADLKNLSCYECHDAEMDAFSATSHHLLIVEHGTDLEASCVACHGDTEAHIDDPEVDNIILEGAVMSGLCQKCHADEGRASLLALGVEGHQDNCFDCHRAGHGVTESRPLLAKPVNDLCSSCHQAERAEFDMPYAHKDIDGPMGCTSCHQVHRQRDLMALNAFGDQHFCTKCHEEKTGPYIFPHDVNEVDACLACHRPHGSATAYLLTRPSTTQLCVECHTDFFATHRDPTLGQQSCTQCHAEIHGSQRDPLLFQP